MWRQTFIGHLFEHKMQQMEALHRKTVFAMPSQLFMLSDPVNNSFQSPLGDNRKAIPRTIERGLTGKWCNHYQEVVQPSERWLRNAVDSRPASPCSGTSHWIWLEHRHKAERCPYLAPLPLHSLAATIPQSTQIRWTSRPLGHFSPLGSPLKNNFQLYNLYYPCENRSTILYDYEDW